MNVNIQPPRIGPQPWEVVRSKLDQALPFANMRETPYYVMRCMSNSPSRNTRR